jgi:hypothetical protein
MTYGNKIAKYFKRIYPVWGLYKYKRFKKYSDARRRAIQSGGLRIEDRAAAGAAFVVCGL